MMESWKRELCGVQSGPEWKDSGRGGAKEELELTKMDTLIMQVSKMSRSVAEVRESCLCLEESIAMEQKEQTDIESELKSSAISPLRGHQHSVTETNLLASTQLIRDQIEGEDRENEVLEDELVILIKRLLNMKESKRTKLREIKERYGNQLVDKEEIEEQKRIVELKHKKDVLTTSILNLKQEKHRTQKDWSRFTEVVISMAKLQYMIRNKCKTVQQQKTAVQMLQTAVHSRKPVESPPVIWRGLVEDSKQANTHSLSSSPQVTEHDLSAPKTSYSTFVPPVQEQEHPQARSSFSTSLSLLKLLSTKFGDKKVDNCSWNIQKGSEGTVDSSISEECPQIINSFICSQAQALNTSHCLFKNRSQIIASSEPNSLSFNCQHNPNKNKHQIWNQTPGSKNVNPAQGSTSSLLDSVSFSPGLFSPANTQALKASFSKDMDCPSFISQVTRGSPSPRETVSISPQEHRGIEMASQKFKSVKVPLAKPKSAEMAKSRGFESPHIKFKAFGAPYLLPRCTRVPPSSRGNGKPSSRHLSIYSQVPCQKSSRRYNNPSLANTEVSGFSHSAKHVTYVEKSQEFVAPTDCPEEKSPVSSENDENGSHLCPKTSMPTAASPSNSFSRPSSNTVPSAEDEATPSILPIPMEVDNHESLKVTNPVPSLQKSSGETCHTVFMEPLNTKNTSHFSEGSQQNSTTTISRAEVNIDSRPVPSCIPPVSISISSSTSSPHTITKKQKKPAPQDMKFLQYKQSPLTPSSDLDHSSQEFSSSTLATGGSLPFMFQNDLQASNEGNKQFNLFGSPSAESLVQESSRNSESNFFILENSVNSRTDSTTSGLFNFNLSSDGELTEHGDSSFFSSLFDSSSDANSHPNETSGFHLF